LYYLFHGDDEYSIKETLTGLQSKLGEPDMLDLNTINFEGQTLTFSELRHACDSIPFLADKRLVIVHNLMAQKPQFLEELIDYLPHLPETTRLFFVESKLMPEKHPLVKLANSDDDGYVKAFKRPKGGSLENWIRKRVRDDSGQIAPRAVHLLAINVGNDLALLDNEIEKLLLYKRSEIIEAEDVWLLCPHVAEASIFDLVDALGNRNGRIAARLLHQKLREGADPFRLFAMFVRQFRLLIQVKELQEEGSQLHEIVETIKIHNFVAGKLSQQSKNFSLSQLEQIYAHLLEIDVGVKTGKIDMTTALDLFVAGITN
jgi:DNA polymerase-3 subunit delta